MIGHNDLLWYGKPSGRNLLSVHTGHRDLSSPDRTDHTSFFRCGPATTVDGSMFGQCLSGRANTVPASVWPEDCAISMNSTHHALIVCHFSLSWLQLLPCTITAVTAYCWSKQFLLLSFTWQRSSAMYVFPGSNCIHWWLYYVWWLTTREYIGLLGIPIRTLRNKYYENAPPSTTYKFKWSIKLFLKFEITNVPFKNSFWYTATTI